MVALTLILLHKEGLVTDVGGSGSGSGWVAVALATCFLSN
jgi:hypothetical protein